MTVYGLVATVWLHGEKKQVYCLELFRTKEGAEKYCSPFARFLNAKDEYDDPVNADEEIDIVPFTLNDGVL